MPTGRITVACPLFAVLMAMQAHAQSDSPQGSVLTFSRESCPLPEFPVKAVRAGVTGLTQLEFDVAADGRVSVVRLLKRSGDSEGHALLDSAAAASAFLCHYPPEPNGSTRHGHGEFDWKIEK